jgi:Abnormal spindle-like microcephaly-assoc'd, ASPM-SPD-2-Hydin
MVTNNQAAPLNVSSIATTGDFAQTNNCGTTVAAGGNCKVSVKFTPTVVGTRTGSLTITDDATSSPQIVSLSGKGVN